MSTTRWDWFSTCLAMAAWPEAWSALQQARVAADSPTPHLETSDAGAAAEIDFESQRAYQPAFGYDDAQVTPRMSGERE